MIALEQARQHLETPGLKQAVEVLTTTQAETRWSFLMPTAGGSRTPRTRRKSPFPASSQQASPLRGGTTSDVTVDDMRACRR